MQGACPAVHKSVFVTTLLTLKRGYDYESQVSRSCSCFCRAVLEMQSMMCKGWHAGNDAACDTNSGADPALQRGLGGAVAAAGHLTTGNAGHPQSQRIGSWQPHVSAVVPIAAGHPAQSECARKVQVTYTSCPFVENGDHAGQKRVLDLEELVSSVKFSNPAMPWGRLQ